MRQKAEMACHGTGFQLVRTMQESEYFPLASTLHGLKTRATNLPPGSEELETRCRPTPDLRPLASAFTLTELMISIALVLVLILGVNAVFRMSSDTVGTGVALSDVVRSHRGTQRVIATDAKRMVMLNEMPFLLIQSQAQSAFRDNRDLEADDDADPLTADFDRDGTFTAISPAIYNERNHRIDRLSFFARDVETPFLRQTGSKDSVNGNLWTGDSSTEAWIWYGHLKLPDNAVTPAYMDPGVGDKTTNPNNYFASRWALGRFVLLLQESPVAADGYIKNTAGTFPPLSEDSEWDDDATRNIDESRYDVAETTIGSFSVGIGITWWPQFDYRFNAKPWVTKSSIMSSMADEMALTVPALVSGASQFIVEYAGNFLTQNADGTVSNAVPDANGEIDFFVENIGGTDVRRIRWYGLPRDTNGDGQILSSGLTNNDIKDIVPLRDIRGTAAAFERVVLTQQADYAAGMSSTDRYICAWDKSNLTGTGPEVLPPSMLRIIIQLIDANGRLAEGQTVEHVFELK